MTAAAYNEYHQVSGRPHVGNSNTPSVRRENLVHWTNEKRKRPVDWSARAACILGAFSDSDAPETSGKLGTYLP